MSDFASFDVPLWVWAALVASIAAMLIVDLLLVHRTAHVITFKEAAIESGVWIALGLSFTFVVLGWHGGQAAGEYLSGYLIEKSLSVDNVFVWAVIFSFFGVPREYQFRVLFWGIFGALVLRAIFIFAGVALIQQFEWVLYVFGAFLLYTAVKIARHDGAEVHPENNLALKLVRRVVPSTNEYDGQKLFTRRTGALLATPLFAVLVLIETTDVVFAVDSIPAILAVSREPFIVFASNAFAILGLRALYFLFAGLQDRFVYLNNGLGVILGFVGLKFIVEGIGEQTGNERLHIPTWASLGFIALVLIVTFWLSWRHEQRHGTPDEAAGDDEAVREGAGGEGAAGESEPQPKPTPE